MSGSFSRPELRDLPAAEPVVETTAAHLVDLFGLHACWFEPFPFDAQMPRIEPGRIVLPAAEPGVASWSLDAGIELPVRHGGLPIGRFVLVPDAPTTGARFSPNARAYAICMAQRVGAFIADDLRGGVTGGRS